MNPRLWLRFHHCHASKLECRQTEVCRVFQSLWRKFSKTYTNMHLSWVIWYDCILLTYNSTHFWHFILFKNLVHWQFAALKKSPKKLLIPFDQIFTGKTFWDLFLVVPGKSHSICWYFHQGTFLGSMTLSRRHSIPCQWQLPTHLKNKLNWWKYSCWTRVWYSIILK